MNLPTFLIASTLNTIIAQRLVRKICKNCIESYNLDTKAYEDLQKQFNIENLEKTLSDLGYLNKKQKIKDTLFYRGRGCQQCNNSGYKGRIGIYEILEINEELSQLIIKKAPRTELEKAALSSGMTTILQDGFIKAKTGITSIEEVLRVTKE
jgi:type IV pilus assembly protein PilB